MAVGTLLDHSVDQVLRDAAEAKSTYKKSVATLDVVDCLLRTAEHLLAETA